MKTVYEILCGHLEQNFKYVKDMIPIPRPAENTDPLISAAWDAAIRMTNKKQNGTNIDSDYSNVMAQLIYELKYTYCYTGTYALAYNRALKYIDYGLVKKGGAVVPGQPAMKEEGDSEEKTIRVLSLGAGNLVDYLGLSLVLEAQKKRNYIIDYTAVDYTYWHMLPITDTIEKMNRNITDRGRTIEKIEREPGILPGREKDTIHIYRGETEGDIKKYIEAKGTEQVAADIVFLPSVLNELPKDTIKALCGLLTERMNLTENIKKNELLVCTTIHEKDITVWNEIFEEISSVYKIEQLEELEYYKEPGKKIGTGKIAGRVSNEVYGRARNDEIVFDVPKVIKYNVPEAVEEADRETREKNFPAYIRGTKYDRLNPAVDSRYAEYEIYVLRKA